MRLAKLLVLKIGLIWCVLVWLCPEIERETKPAAFLRPKSSKSGVALLGDEIS